MIRDFFNLRRRALISFNFVATMLHGSLQLSILESARNDLNNDF